jgi:hypothetical protein
MARQRAAQSGLQEVAVFKGVNSSLQMHAGPVIVSSVVNIPKNMSRYLRKYSFSRQESGKWPASTICSARGRLCYESRAVCCVAGEQQNGANLLQSAVTKDDCLLISGRGLHTQRPRPCRCPHTFYMHARWTAELSPGISAKTGTKQRLW